jgi:hypothetical protein
MRTVASLVSALLIGFIVFAADMVTMDSAEASDEQPMLIFDFQQAAAADWSIVNDGVMGGRSQGFVSIADGVLRFEGELVTDGGGFTSVRTNRSLDLTGYDGLALRVRGNGRRFEVEVFDGERYGWRTVSRRAGFPTSQEWQTVRVPFSALRDTVFGRPVSVDRVDLSSIERIGFYILDGIDGPFWLEVGGISAYADD